jgi:hypothetical protein
VPTVAAESTNELAVVTFDAAKKIGVVRGRRVREDAGKLGSG